MLLARDPKRTLEMRFRLRCVWRRRFQCDFTGQTLLGRYVCAPKTLATPFERRSMSVQNEYEASRSQSETLDDAHDWAGQASDFVLIAEGKPPSRIELAPERILIC